MLTDITYPDFVGLLTEEQRNTVRKTWSIVRKDVVKYGTDIFLRFFQKYPDYQNYFKHLKNLPIEQLKGNEMLKGHVVGVFAAISTVIDEFEEPESATEDLFRIAAMHVPRKITVEMFNNMGKTVVDYLVETLGGHMMNQRAVLAWRKTWEAIVDVIAQGLQLAVTNPDAEILKTVKTDSGNV